MTTADGETLAAFHRRLSVSRLAACGELMGVPFDGDTLWVPFFNRTYLVSPNRMEDTHGNQPTDAVGLVLCRYILQYPSIPVPDGRQITFRELSGAGPLVSSFARNTNKLIASAFGGNMVELIARSIKLNGERHTTRSDYDVSVRFPALHGVPLFLHFNDNDDLFPARTTLLFYQSAERYLDMQGLFMLGTWLAGSLISEKAEATIG